MQVEFLTDGEILPAVREIVSETGDIDVAVAFWGSGAEVETGIAAKLNGCVRIVCDASSGCCNPETIEKIAKLPNVKGKSLDGLHAKVWVSSKKIIVGSANASTNGLGFDTASSRTGTAEAAIALSDPLLIEKARDWFNSIWGKSTAQYFEDLDYATMNERWRHRKSSRTGNRDTMSLTDSLHDESPNLGDFRFDFTPGNRPPFNRMSFADKTQVNVTYWRDIPREVFKWLCDNDLLQLTDGRIEVERPRGRCIVAKRQIHPNGRQFTSPFPYKNFHMETQASIGQCVAHAKRLLQVAEVDAKTVKIVG